MRPLRSVCVEAICLAEKHDDPRRIRQVRLVLVGAERRECLDPFGRHTPVIILALLVFGRLPDALLQVRIRDGHERPRLLVCATWSRPRGADREFDRLTGHRVAGKVPRRAASAHRGEELASAANHLLWRLAGELERGESRLGHEDGRDGRSALDGALLRVAQPNARSSRLRPSSRSARVATRGGRMRRV